jgi:hypothetical protein
MNEIWTNLLLFIKNFPTWLQVLCIVILVVAAVVFGLGVKKGNKGCLLFSLAIALIQLVTLTLAFIFSTV